MKPVFALYWMLVFSLKAYSQNDPPIRSGELIQAAETLYDSGDYKKSLNLYEQIDRNDSNYVRSLYGRIIVLEADSQYNKAILLCQEALRLREQREVEPDIYNSYGNLLNKLGQKEKAISVFNEGIKKYPSYTLLYFNKGIGLLDQERYAEAEIIFKETLLINPYQYSAHFFLGQCAIHQGKIIPAFLNYVGYLLINPEGKYSKRCINILGSISGGKDEILEYKNKRTEEGDENYSSAEEILLSKIALEKDYKLRVSLDDPIFRQIQVVIEKLDYKEEDTDFWMQYYVPYFKKLFNADQFEPFIFWTFEGVQIKEIQDYNKKNKKSIDQFTTQTADYFNQIRSTRELNFNKRADQRNKYLYTNGVLQGRGELTNDGKDFIGSWTFYYPQGNIKSTGQFNETKREGNWTYYFFSGNLKTTETYKNGKQEGKQIYYSEKGLMTYDESYSNDLENGQELAYWTNGRLYSSSMYKSGKLDGEYREFFSGGQLNAVKFYVNNVLSGPFTYYYNNGLLKESGNYVNGSLDGPYKEYYENGQLSTKGQFRNGVNDGEWIMYYDNGKMKTRMHYINTKIEGVQEEFYEDGTLQSEYNYKKGVLNGESKSYDRDHIPYAKFQFVNNVLESAAYFDKAGKQISSSERKNNRIELDIFLPDGTKIAHRPLNKNGEIDGTETSFYPSGKVYQAFEYQDGKKNGNSTEYYRNDRKRLEQTMVNDKSDGRFISYYPDGKKESEGWEVDGQAAGYWNYYDELGNLDGRNYMVDGELSGYKMEYYPNGIIFIEKKFYRGLLEEMRQFDSTGKLLVYDSFPKFTGNFLLLYPNGSKMQECRFVNGGFEGPLTQYYFDGSVEFIQYYKGGLLDSNYTAYNFHHIKSAEGTYKAGKKTGIWKYYDEEGRLESTMTFETNELNGIRQFYDNNNKITGQISYLHDQRDGQASTTDPDGSLLYTVNYNEGEPVGYSYIGKDGKPVPEIRAMSGKLELNSFFQNGMPSRKCQFVDNKLNGADILYYANGKLRSQDYSEFGILMGPSSEYYPNGNLKRICKYHNDHLHGQCLEYNEQGVLVRELNYYNNLKHGESKYYSEKGELLETRFYFNDFLLEIKK